MVVHLTSELIIKLMSTTEEQQNESSREILKQLQILQKLCEDGNTRDRLDWENFVNLSKLLGGINNDWIGELSSEMECLLVEAFRFLRNSVVGRPWNQDFIWNRTQILQETLIFLKNNVVTATSLSEEIILASRCSLQFLANAMVDNKANCNAISSMGRLILPELMSCLQEDEKVIQYSAMVIHLGLKHSPEKFLSIPANFKILLNNLHLEFVIYAMESLVQHEQFPEFYDNLESENRVKLLNFLKARTDLLKTVDSKFTDSLKARFMEKSDYILQSKLGNASNDHFCWEIVMQLEILCSLSAETDALQTDSSLLTTVLYLLKAVHELGKDPSASDNAFSPVEDLAKLTLNCNNDSIADDIRAHPTFQFKGNLIRLVANLCHRNKANQDKVRELECLPIILDNCKLDARNPFIGQWSVLAIRNLCEGNLENQAYIREVQRIDTEKLLPKLELVDMT